MPTRKKQHYVPKFLLRHFAVDNEAQNIGIFHIGSKRFVASGSIDGQAYKNYFYGKDGVIEDCLHVIEGVVAPILRKISETRQLPPEPESLLSIILFTVIQHFRTNASVTLANASWDAFAKQILKDHPVFKACLDAVTFGWDAPVQMLVSNATLCTPILFDLERKLLFNVTQVPFITSDHPVVFYNQMLERANCPSGITGLGCAGLQIMMPVSPDMTLLLYDAVAYKCKARQGKNVVLTNKHDVHQLNRLQALNCQNHLYCNRAVKEGYLRRLLQETEDLRSSRAPNVSQGDIVGTNNTLIAMHTNDIRVGLTVGFMGAKITIPPGECLMAPLRDREFMLAHMQEIEKFVVEAERRETRHE